MSGKGDFMPKLHRLFLVILLLTTVFLIAPVTSSQAQGGITATAKSQLTFRSGPATTYSSQGLIPAKTVLPAIGRNATNTWVQVNFNNAPGWVILSLVTVTGDLNALPVVEVPAPPKPVSASSIRAATNTICTTHVAVNGAPAYDGQPGLHPAIFLNDTPRGGTHTWNYRMTGLTGTKPQLAVCLGAPVTTTYQSCPYESPKYPNLTLNLQDISVTVKVVMISTGQEIGSTILVGTRPLDCQPIEAFYGGSLVKTRVGAAPTVDQLKAFITPYIKK
jgi:uncharacterized protein YraI